MAKKNPISKKKDKAHLTHSFKKNANNFYNHVENSFQMENQSAVSAWKFSV